jgi:outer membrane protein OmpA-like peptidoglycan-associated protein/tetratricopeptide (TPR) repeat protein
MEYKAVISTKMSSRRKLFGGLLKSFHRNDNFNCYLQLLKDNLNRKMASIIRPFALWLGTCLLSLVLLSAQNPTREADAHFNNYNFSLALEAYKKVLEKQEASLIVVRRIADCYRFLNNSKEAEFWYAQTLTFPEHEAENIKFFADAARKNGHYEKARLLYLRYAAKLPAQGPLARQLAASCLEVQRWIEQPSPHVLHPLAGISSGNLDFSPVFYQQGLVFTSNRVGADSQEEMSGWTGKPLAKLYYARADKGGFSPAEPLPAPLNSKFENGSAVFNQAEDIVYFTRVNKLKPKTNWIKFAGDHDFVNRLEIYISAKKDGSWTEPVPFPFNNIADFSIGHPALSRSGDTLYFASDMPGGQGNTDIYYSVKSPKGSWSKPVNAGKAINTPGKELFPVVAANGRFYFSSEGHLGMGGLDIFEARGSGANWKNVQNLQYPLNSSFDDFGILFDKSGTAGYLSTNRNSANGSDNIYAFQFTAPTCKLTGWTLEKILTKSGETQESPVSQVLVRVTNNRDTTTMVSYSDTFGNFTFNARDGIDYTIKGSKKGYLTTTSRVAGNCQSVVNLVKTGLTLHRDVLNQPIILDKIYYDVNSYKIRPDAALELDKLAQVILDNPGIKIELSSHTDSRAADAYNKLLSQMRADAAVHYILGKGVDAASITAQGFGETRLMNKCADGVSCPESLHQLNRRTEFTILQLK